MSDDVSEIVKVITLGRCYVGKTSILTRYAEGKLQEEYRCFYLCDFTIKSLNRHTLLSPKNYLDVGRFPKEHIKVHLCDTVGQERFRHYTHSYFRRMNVALLCFDVSDPDSYSSETLKTFIFDLLDKHNRETCIVAFVGNKIDKLTAEGIGL
eukprot:PhF_6_TR758/c0_g1_i1/m.1190